MPTCAFIPILTKCDLARSKRELVDALARLDEELRIGYMQYRIDPSITQSALGSHISATQFDAGLQRAVPFSSYASVLDRFLTDVSQGHPLYQPKSGMSVREWWEMLMQAISELGVVGETCQSWVQQIKGEMRQAMALSSRWALAQKVKIRARNLKATGKTPFDNVRDVLQSGAMVIRKTLSSAEHEVTMLEKVEHALVEMLLSNPCWRLMEKEGVAHVHTRFYLDHLFGKSGENENKLIFHPVDLKSRLPEVHEATITHAERKRAEQTRKTALSSLLGAVALAALFTVIAPGIGTAIGASMGLSGAAATSAGLAFLGGGSLAAGGLGMVGGTVMIALAGGLIGAATVGAVRLATASAVAAVNVQQKRTQRVMSSLANYKYRSGNHFVVDVGSACFRQESAFITYIGCYDSEKLERNGRGIILSPTGLPIYEGAFRNGLPHGSGNFFAPPFEKHEFYSPPGGDEGLFDHYLPVRELYLKVRGLVLRDYLVMAEAHFSNGKLEKLVPSQEALEPRQAAMLDIVYNMLNKSFLDDHF
uniref:Uncharacterized protein n=1 Tax=Palpitomonas bilix TaxID=652834 RepID=A0A7S3DDC8_9EUKA